MWQRLLIYLYLTIIQVDILYNILRWNFITLCLIRAKFLLYIFLFWEYPYLFLVPLVRNASLNADYKTSFKNLHIKKYLLFLFFYAVYISKLIGLINRKLQWQSILFLKDFYRSLGRVSPYWSRNDVRFRKVDNALC